MTAPEAKEKAEKLQKKIDEQVTEFKNNIELFEELCRIIIATLSKATKTIPCHPIVHGRVKEIDSLVEKGKKGTNLFINYVIDLDLPGYL